MTHKMQALYAILIESQTRTTSSAGLLVFRNIFHNTLDKIFLVHLHPNILDCYKDSNSVALCTYFASALMLFFECIINLSVESQPSILTHLRHFITCGKGNENVFRTNKKSFSKQSLQLVIVAHFQKRKTVSW